MASPPPPPPPQLDAGRNRSPTGERRRQRSVSPSPTAKGCPRPDRLHRVSAHKSRRGASDSDASSVRSERKHAKKSRSRRSSKHQHAKIPDDGDGDDYDYEKERERRRSRRRSRKESTATVVGEGSKTPLRPPSSSSFEATAYHRRSPPASSPPPDSRKKQPNDDNDGDDNDGEDNGERKKEKKKEDDDGGSGAEAHLSPPPKDALDRSPDAVGTTANDATEDAPDTAPAVTPGKRSVSATASPPSITANDEDGTSSNKRQRTEDVAAPNFGLSGRLAAETNTTNGVVLKYSEPPEARRPREDTKWRIYVFKDHKDIDMHHVDASSGYLFGRDRKVADIPTDHPSCSSQHAVLQYRQIAANVIKPYIIDLSSTNGTFLNGERIPSQRYVELRSEDVIKLGFSTREYVLLRE
ncbi:hypothetical protein LPJ72_003524 [Coemansia sp. Benny D160-2]|nr:hypothetical protein LPJ72_003524 [Coemansia sp. Benny D160-2]